MNKSIIILALCAFAFSKAQQDSSNSTNDGEHINGVNGWFVPNANGITEWLDFKDAEKLLESIKLSEGEEMALSPVTFFLYTKANPTFGQIISADAKSIKASHFNPKNPTRFIIHGFLQGFLSSMNLDITKAWLKNGDYNVIVVDWARARTVDYVSSVVAVPITGEKVANLIDSLVKNFGVSLSDVYVIGHSLGAHVAGFTGKSVTTGTLGTIVGLDPALPLYNWTEPNERLNSTDADYVQTIQTCGGNLGFLEPIGQAVYYVNGGRDQPGCILDEALLGICSHERSCTYYAEDISLDDFGVIQCKDYISAVNKDCGTTFASTRMGIKSEVDKVRGIFYVPVNSAQPYGKTSL